MFGLHLWLARPDRPLRRIVTEFFLRILWPLVLVYGIYQGCATVKLFAPLRDTSPVEEDPYTVHVPEDLVAVVLQYTDSWAQEDVMKSIREKYATLRDWNAVRSAFGVGRIDA